MQTKIVKKILLVGLMLGVHLVVRPADEQTYEDEKEKSAVLVQAACRGALSRMDLNQPVVQQSVVEQERFTQELTQKSTQESAQESAQKEEAQKLQATPAAPMQSSNSSSSEDTSSDSDESFEHQSEVLGGQAHEKNLIRELHELLAIHDNDVQQAFFYAVQNKVLWAIFFLLDRGADVNAFNQHDEAALMWAVANDDAAAVELLLARGAKQNLTDQQGRTPLLIAAQEGQVNAMDALLRHESANIKQRNPQFETALMIAARAGHCAVVDRLLRAGAEPNLKKGLLHCDLITMMAAQDDGTTALMMAAHAGHWDVVDRLLVGGADLGLQDVNGATALTMAREAGHFAIADALLAADVVSYEVNVESKTYTPLSLKDLIIRQMFALGGLGIKDDFEELPPQLRNEILEKLLVKNDSDAQNALMYAARNNMVWAIQPLLNRGADINFVAQNYQTALRIACFNGHVETVKALIATGLIDVTNKYDRMAFRTACTNGHIAVVEALIAAGVDVDSADIYGYTCLIQGAMGGRIAIVEALLAAGARIDVANVSGETALMLAALYGRTEIVRLLLDRGADVNAVNLKDETALILIAGHQRMVLVDKMDRIAIVEALISAGGIDAFSRHYRTALCWAATTNCVEIIPILIDEYRNQLKKILQEKYIDIVEIEELGIPTGLIEQALPVEVAQKIAFFLGVRDIASLRETNTHCYLYAHDEFNKNRKQSVIELREQLIRFIKSAVDAIDNKIEKYPLIYNNADYGKIIILLQDELERVENTSLFAGLTVEISPEVRTKLVREFAEDFDVGIAGPAPKIGCLVAVDTNIFGQPQVECAQAQVRNAAIEQWQAEDDVIPGCAALAQRQTDVVSRREQKRKAEAARVALMAEQDREYAESLVSDQQKERLRIEKGGQAALECQQSGVACQAAAAAGAQELLTAVEEREDGPAPTEELMEQEEQMPATAQELRGLLEAAAMARMGGRQ